MKQYYLIIVAGGAGTRMNSAVPKQFLEVNGKNILHHTVERFWSWHAQLNICVVLPEDQMDRWEEYCNEKGFQVPHWIAPGGTERFHSVKNGIDRIKAEAKGGLQHAIIGIHDAVRPLVNHQTINNCYTDAEKHGAAIPVVPVTDSIRQIEGHQSKAVDRKQYVAVQTPQCFHADVLLQAYQQPFSPLFTDDASVVEATGQSIHLTEGNTSNIKITHPQDLHIFQAIAASEGS